MSRKKVISQEPQWAGQDSLGEELLSPTNSGGLDTDDGWATPPGGPPEEDCEEHGFCEEHEDRPEGEHREEHEVCEAHEVGRELEVRNDCEEQTQREERGGEATLDAGGNITAESVIEAILFATDKPIPARRLAQLLGIGDGNDVRRHVAALNERYEQTGASFRIEMIAKGFQMLTLPVFDRWIGKLVKSRKESRLSPAALETLAVVAYKQPVMRAEIESIRGVAGGDVLARLREMKLVTIVGRAEEVGRPLLYGTTNRFLEVFGLSSLKDLPQVDELKPPEPLLKKPRLVEEVADEISDADG